MERRRKLNRMAFVNLQDESALPHSIRVYFDPYCGEYELLNIESKLLDLAYVFSQGYDPGSEINALLASHDYTDEHTPKSACVEFISYLRSGDKVDAFSLLLEENMTLGGLLQLLKQELLLRYDCFYFSESHMLRTIHWNYDYFLQSVRGQSREDVIRQICSVTPS